MDFLYCSFYELARRLKFLGCPKTFSCAALGASAAIFAYSFAWAVGWIPEAGRQTSVGRVTGYLLVLFMAFVAWIYDYRGRGDEVRTAGGRTGYSWLLFATGLLTCAACLSLPFITGLILFPR
jgi:hypothetical protein